MAKDILRCLALTKKERDAVRAVFPNADLVKRARQGLLHEAWAWSTTRRVKKRRKNK